MQRWIVILAVAVVAAGGWGWMEFRRPAARPVERTLAPGEMAQTQWVGLAEWAAAKMNQKMW